MLTPAVPVRPSPVAVKLNGRPASVVPEKFVALARPIPNPKKGWLALVATTVKTAGAFPAPEGLPTTLINADALSVPLLAVHW